MILFYLVGTLIVYNLDVTYGLRKFYLEDDCNGTINMEANAISAGRLTVTRRSKYRSKLNCHVTIVAPLDRRITVVFREMDIEWEVNCDDDFVSLRDGHTPSSPLVYGLMSRVCGHKVPPGNYVTTGNALTVIFQSDLYKQNDGFEIVFTSFHIAKSCPIDELRCDNGRCISASLQCNNFNNCGDNSDECQVNVEVAIAITLSVFLITIIGVGSVLLYKKKARRNHTKRQKQLKMAIMSGAKIGIGIGAIEIQPCDACLRKIKEKEWSNRCSARAKRTWQTEPTEPTDQVLNDKIPEKCVENGEDNKGFDISCDKPTNIPHRASI